MVDRCVFRCCTNLWNGVTDPTRRRALSLGCGGLGGDDLRPGHEGETISVPLDDVLFVSPVAAVFDATRGRILATGEGGLVSMAVRAGAATWLRVDRPSSLPLSNAIGHVLAMDDAGDQVVLFGGATRERLPSPFFLLHFGST